MPRRGGGDPRPGVPPRALRALSRGADLPAPLSLYQALHCLRARDLGARGQGGHKAGGDAQHIGLTPLTTVLWILALAATLPRSWLSRRTDRRTPGRHPRAAAAAQPGPMACQVPAATPEPDVQASRMTDDRDAPDLGSRCNRAGGRAAMYDVIVVGARCAGAPTAMLLAQRGRRVLLVERTGGGRWWRARWRRPRTGPARR